MDEFKDDIKEPKPEEELLEIAKEHDPDYDPDDDLDAGMHPISAAFLGIFGIVFIYVLGGFIIDLFLGLSLSPGEENVLRLKTITGQIVFMLLPTLFLAKLIYPSVDKIIRIRKPELKEILFFVIGLIILNPLLQILISIQYHLVDSWANSFYLIKTIKHELDFLNTLLEDVYKKVLSSNNLLEFILVIFTVSIVPPLCEETLFRGFIQRSFELKIKPIYAAIITAFFFSLVHFNPYGFLALFSLGLFFGYAAYKTKSLVIPMILHFINNLSAVLLYHFIGDDELIKTDAVLIQNELSSYVMMFFALSVLFVGLIIFINKYYTSKKLIKEN